MVSSIDDVPTARTWIDLGDGLEHEIDEPWSLRWWRPFDKHEFVHNPTAGELRRVEAQGAEETSLEIDAVIVVATGQDDAERRRARRRRDLCVRQLSHSR